MYHNIKHIVIIYKYSICNTLIYVDLVLMFIYIHDIHICVYEHMCTYMDICAHMDGYIKVNIYN